MKAAILRQPGAPLAIEEAPTPKAGRGEILIKVRACGVCHTDLHLMAGEWNLPKLPLILGHEVVGEVVEVGEGVQAFKTGSRAGVPWIYSTCGACEYCTTDREPLCPSIVVTGFMVDGGYAEYMKAAASHAVEVPHELSWNDAAPLFCAGVTPYRALKISGAKVGETVVIWGVGGLGHYAVQIGKAMGTRVVAVDVATAKLDLARKLGADLVINASEGRPEEAIRDWGGAHVVVCLAPATDAILRGFSALRRGGTLVLVGLPKGDFTLPILGTVAKGIRILTSGVGTRQDLREVLALRAQGKIKTVSEPCRLEDLNEVFDDMRRGKVFGRRVVTFS